MGIEGRGGGGGGIAIHLCESWCLCSTCTRLNSCAVGAFTTRANRGPMACLLFSSMTQQDEFLPLLRHLQYTTGYRVFPGASCSCAVPFLSFLWGYASCSWSSTSHAAPRKVLRSFVSTRTSGKRLSGESTSTTAGTRVQTVSKSANCEYAKHRL